MATTGFGPRKPAGGKLDTERLDRIVAKGHKARDERDQGYRERSLKIHPWICARCGREFTRENLRELTVHHKDHNHDNNPFDGSNWENLCIYCHDNEHARYADLIKGGGVTIEGEARNKTATHNPFAGLKGMLEAKKK